MARSNKSAGTGSNFPGKTNWVGWTQKVGKKDTKSGFSSIQLLLLFLINDAEMYNRTTWVSASKIIECYWYTYMTWNYRIYQNLEALK